MSPAALGRARPRGGAEGLLLAEGMTHPILMGKKQAESAGQPSLCSFLGLLLPSLTQMTGDLKVSDQAGYVHPLSNYRLRNSKDQRMWLSAKCRVLCAPIQGRDRVS